jgi:hypothetical protein
MKYELFKNHTYRWPKVAILKWPILLADSAESVEKSATGFQNWPLLAI